MKKLLFISLLFGIILNSYTQTVINLSPDSTLYDLHLLPPSAAVPFDSATLERYLVTNTFLLDNGVVVALVDTITPDTLRVYVTGSDQPTPVTSMDSVSLDTSFQIGWTGVQFDSIILTGGQIYWYSVGRGFNKSKVIYTTPNAPTTLTISSPDSDTLTYAVSNFSSPADGTTSDSCMVRWDTVAIPTTITAGELVYRGDTNVVETDFFIDMADSLKVYVSAFAKNDTGTAIGAWSVAKTDSVWIDSTGAGPSIALFDSLKQYYSFEDASGNAVDSIGNFDLTSTNMIYSQTGIVGNCNQYDGTGYFANTGNDAGEYDTLTISFWFKTSTEASYMGMVTCYDGADRGYDIPLRSNVPNDGDIIASVRDGATSGEVKSTTAQLDDGAWHHTVLIFNRPDVKLYIDDSSIDTDSWNFAINYNSTEFYVGARDGALLFTGYIDELGIWNREISTSDITWLYNTGSGRSYTDILNK